jgi:hypothetical protein
MKNKANGNGGWPGGEDERADAVYNFCKALEEDRDLRKRCLDKDLPDAKNTFAKEGPYKIPEDVIVRAFEIEDEEPGDKLVTIKLPKPGKLPPRDQFIAKEVWVCTYVAWKALMSE